MFRKPLAFGERCREEYGDLVSLRLAGMDAIQLGHPDHVQYVLEDNVDNYRKGEFYRQELELLGEGLLTSEGELWEGQRELIGPMFHPRRIRRYADTIAGYAEREVDTWDPNRPLDATDSMQQLTLEILAKALFNIDIRERTGSISEAVSEVMHQAIRSRRIPFSLPDWLPTPGKIKYDRAVTTFDSAVADIIEDHRTSSDPPDDVVTALLQAQGERDALDDRQIRDEVLTLLLAGHDTTALALSYLWYLLGTHQDVQSRVIEEIERTVGDDRPSGIEVTDLNFTNHVIKETLRLYPPAYFLSREPRADDVIDGYRIPEGSLILINQWLFHRDDRFFEAPETFRPDRWTDGFEDDLHPFAYFPFGGGPRQCLGRRFALLEMLIVVVTTLQRYRIDLAIDPPIEVDPLVSLRPASPIEIVPRPR
jgi:cytochrome P450